MAPGCADCAQGASGKGQPTRTAAVPDVRESLSQVLTEQPGQACILLFFIQPDLMPCSFFYEICDLQYKLLIKKKGQRPSS